MLNKAKRVGRSNLFLVALVGLLIVFLFTTDPNKLPIALILFVIGWFYLIFSLTTYHILQVLKLKSFTDSPRRLTVYSFIAGVVPTVILMLISINQLTARDLLLLTILGVVVLIYISRFRITE